MSSMALSEGEIPPTVHSLQQYATQEVPGRYIQSLSSWSSDDQDSNNLDFFPQEMTVRRTSMPLHTGLWDGTSDLHSREGLQFYSDGAHTSVLQYPHAPYTHLSSGPPLDLPLQTDGFSTPFNAIVDMAPGEHSDHNMTGPSSHDSTLQSSDTQVHNYCRLPTIDDDVLALWLHAHLLPDRIYWTCLGEHCGRMFRKKSSAYDHVLKKHFGETKLFGCTKCLAKFSLESTAKRHRDSQTRRFSCTVPGCSKVFTRLDYRNYHRAKCAFQRKEESICANIPD